MTPAWFITGTDTGVGKTRIAAALCRALAGRGISVAAMKPVASGCSVTPEGLRNDDALALLAAMNVRARYSDVNPYAFAPAIAPHIAAQEAGIGIDFDVLDRAFERLRMQSQAMVVEGAGGWLAPLDATRGFADLAAHWRMDVVLVVGMRLGCLNHALLTAESIERRGLRLRGWVANSIDPGFERLADNIASLQSRLRAPCLGNFSFEPLAPLEALAQGLAVHTLLT
jgi:dethiobiotin synthetase